MFKNRLTVTVPEPCHEDWNAMTRHDKGRYCNSCQKTVVDFTFMTDAEVVRWLSKQKGNTCGRFTEKQLARELIASTPSNNSWTWRAVALGLSAWLSTKTVEAQTKSSTPSSQQPVFTAIRVQPNATMTTSSQDSEVVLKGQVIDAETNEPLPGVSILLKGTRIASVTNGEGRFILDVPSKNLGGEPVLTFSFIGYKEQERLLNNLQISSSIIIQLQAENKPIDEVVIVGGAFPIYKWYTPRGLYQRVHNLFH
ncbi:hypothetical protein GU926_13030 [Nibribacter ruber]|uniref:Carboxypeptidase-like regulatory domain-containing protein n=1 Tax=Nibribacter ruber TaxID=2698458 RepID=A0A6P1P0Y0_9BACT|nr:carboxypeptidase-like regulatory domain-containing protein [Nibribacter ruber]QHL88305.1 hypothetical protein GU926_13030 [Nibribacter ruber]